MCVCLCLIVCVCCCCCCCFYCCLLFFIERTKNETTIRQYLSGNRSDHRKRDIGANLTLDGASLKPVEVEKSKKWTSCEVIFNLNNVVNERNLPSSTPTASNSDLKLGIDLHLGTNIKMKPTIKRKKQWWENPLKNRAFLSVFNNCQFWQHFQQISTSTGSPKTNRIYSPTTATYLTDS